MSPLVAACLRERAARRAAEAQAGKIRANRDDPSGIGRAHAALRERRYQVWLEGGWGVDALLGRQTRLHKDLDIILRVSDLPKLREILIHRGFSIQEGGTPSNFVLADDAGREVDVHAVDFDRDGNGVYRMPNGYDWVFPVLGFTGRGTVGGVSVRCLTPEIQVYCHGPWYAPTENDIRDVELRHERFGVELPPHLKRDEV